jgi:SAM-dependent methyltransferase
MGIARISARLLLSEAAKRPFSGRVLQLGRQHLFFDERDLRSWAETHGVKLMTKHIARNKRPPLMNSVYMDDGSFFAMLGFDQVESCDYSDDEKPTFLLDLNRPIPDELVGRFDIVYDGGTMEHLYDPPQALRNIHALLKEGGRIIHHSPSTNHVDHGFYMFSPCLFADYYAANRYKIEDMHLIEYDRDFMNRLASVYNYVPGCVDDVSFGGFDRGRMLLVHVVATKRYNSTCDAIPQQWQYARKWRDTGAGAESTEAYERAFGSLIAEYEARRTPPKVGRGGTFHFMTRAFRFIINRSRFIPRRLTPRAPRALDCYKIGDW